MPWLDLTPLRAGKLTKKELEMQHEEVCIYHSPALILEHSARLLDPDVPIYALEASLF